MSRFSIFGVQVQDLKPHKTYQQQIDRLSELGLTYKNYDSILEVLKSVGYYRFAGYTYPFRDSLRDSAGKVIGKSDTFQPGSSFEEAWALHEFDRQLRHALRSGLEVLEVGLNAQVGHILGMRHPEAHLDINHLDQVACLQENTLNGRTVTTHEIWIEKFNQLRRSASKEDYVVHHDLMYGGKIPIWVATEFMDFGNTVRLYGLLKKSDRLQIARFFGIDNDQSAVLKGWLVALNVLRNHCAHNNRIWNRVSRSPRVPSERMVQSSLHHLRTLSDRDSKKIYPLVAVLAYLLQSVCGATQFVEDVRVLMDEYKSETGIPLESVMGFPSGWRQQELWLP
jgi:abortive infection bacteriophage resistance protein